MNTSTNTFFSKTDEIESIHCRIERGRRVIAEATAIIETPKVDEPIFCEACRQKRNAKIEIQTANERLRAITVRKKVKR